MVHPAPDDFDAFYADSRQRLLLQTYALTGDLPAARRAVRVAFVVAWHHWPRVARSADPEAWVRPHAWQRARRHHSARPWRRTRGLDPDAQATLTALGKLTFKQRRLLLLAHLADVSLAGMAREAALTREAAERELQAASATFALERGVPSTDVRAALEDLAPVIAGEEWPRGPLLRRAGASRRRTHTAAAMVGAVVALVLVGSAVVGEGTGPGEVRPTLEADRLTEPVEEEPPRASLGPDDLVTQAQANQLLVGGGWRNRGQGDNTRGDGLVVRCQQERFADPEGTAAAVRRFVDPAKDNKVEGRKRATAVQLSELSTTRSAAVEAFTTSRSWYAGCTAPAVRLGRTATVPTIGNGAWLFELRGYRPDEVTVVGVARSGLFTHTVAHTARGRTSGRLEPVAAMLAAAVDNKCGQAGSGPCAGIPRSQARPPLPVRPAPALVGEYDLPAIPRIPRPWVGTDPTRAKVNGAATPCDETSFQGLRGNRTRTFLIPNARVPAAFGLTESIARFPNAGRARGFVSTIRNKLAGCPDDDAASSVQSLARSARGRTELAAWQVVTEVTDNRSVRYLMAVVRNGRAVAQVGFVPAGSRTIDDRAFVELARRAQQRLRYAGQGGDEQKSGGGSTGSGSGGSGGGDN